MVQLKSIGHVRKGGFYWTCPLCGANLDAGEHCDCERAANMKREKDKRNLIKDPVGPHNGGPIREKELYI